MRARPAVTFAPANETSAAAALHPPPALAPGIERSRAGRSRLQYVPALDGLRGLAVGAVLFFHGGFAWAQGGFLGVSLFFTLSGFLITSLVLAERESTGGVGLVAFWGRRARRLIPASLLALILAMIVTAVAVPVSQRVDSINDIRAALLNVANWRFILQGAPYADLTTVPSPVQHYWSLAIEEQFYLVFPLLAAFFLRRRARGLGIALAVITVASFLRQLSLHDLDRIYYGTDTRAAELAIGGLLAIGHHYITALPAVRRWRLPAFTGWVALGAMLALWWGAGLRDEGLYKGGLISIAVISAALILGAVESPSLGRVLSFPPLVGLGKISYGVYLFHFPLFILISQDRVNQSGWALFAMRLAATLSLALVSFFLLERPIRTRRVLRGRLAPAMLATSFAALLLVSIPVISNAETEQLASTGGVDSPVTVTRAETVTTVPDLYSDLTVDTNPVAIGPATTTTTTIKQGSGPRAPRIVVVGDSTAGTNGQGLQKWGVKNGKLEVTIVESNGCTTLPGERFLIRNGYEFTPRGCNTLFSTAAATAKQIGADAIVVFIGSSQLADWTYADLPDRHSVGEPVIDDRYVAALSSALGVLESARVPILWADVPIPAWDLDKFGAQIGSTFPGSGPVTLNNPTRTARINKLDKTNMASHPLVDSWPYAERLQRPDGSVPSSIRPDGLHVSDDGMAQIADDWLYDELAKAFRTVVATKARGLGPVTANKWLPT